VGAWVVPTDEERTIARNAYALLAPRSDVTQRPAVPALVMAKATGEAA
jgi:hypothetical protein